MSEVATKPPLGVAPFSSYSQKLLEFKLLRAKALAGAIFRYRNVQKEIPLEWTVELTNLLDELAPEEVKP